MFRSLRCVAALFLLAVWLPATAHCSIAAIVEIVDDCCGSTCEQGQDWHHHDRCTLVEGGDYLVTASLAHAPHPPLATLACLLLQRARLLVESRPLEPPPWAKDDPAAWVPAWAFVSRAALPARAPSLI